RPRRGTRLRQRPAGPGYLRPCGRWRRVADLAVVRHDRRPGRRTRRRFRPRSGLTTPRPTPPSRGSVAGRARLCQVQREEAAERVRGVVAERTALAEPVSQIEPSGRGVELARPGLQTQAPIPAL